LGSACLVLFWPPAELQALADAATLKPVSSELARVYLLGFFPMWVIGLMLALPPGAGLVRRFSPHLLITSKGLATVAPTIRTDPKIVPWSEIRASPHWLLIGHTRILWRKPESARSGDPLGKEPPYEISRIKAEVIARIPRKHRLTDIDLQRHMLRRFQKLRVDYVSLVLGILFYWLWFR
jgi:hypothetical protein